MCMPVTERNTSSRLGRRRPTSSTAMARSSSKRTTIAQLLAAAFDADRDALGVHVGERRFAANAGERLFDRRKLAGGPRPHLDHVAAGAVLQLVRAFRTAMTRPWSMITM